MPQLQSNAQRLVLFLTRLLDTTFKEENAIYLRGIVLRVLHVYCMPRHLKGEGGVGVILHKWKLGREEIALPGGTTGKKDVWTVIIGIQYQKSRKLPFLAWPEGWGGGGDGYGFEPKYRLLNRHKRRTVLLGEQKLDIVTVDEQTDPVQQPENRG